MNIPCTGCQGTLEVGEDMRGKTVLCAKCGVITRIPDAAPNTTPSDADSPAIKDAILIGAPPLEADMRAGLTRRSREDDEDDDDFSRRQRPVRRRIAPSGSGQNTIVIVVAVTLVILSGLPCLGFSMLGFFAGIAEDRAIEEMRVAEQMELEIAHEVHAEKERAIAERRRDPDLPEIVAPDLWKEDRLPMKALLDPNPDPLIGANLGPNQQTGPLAPDSPLWAKVGRHIEHDPLRTSPLIKGNWGPATFSETAPASGGILVGFFVSSGPDRFIRYVQPIYLTADGEKAGHRYGKAAGLVTSAKAKNGYAVGALTVRSGDLFDGFKITFMKVQGDRLDPQDAYDSAHFGGMGGDPLRISGDGRLIVGIHGRRLVNANITPAGSITSLGLISLP